MVAIEQQKKDPGIKVVSVSEEHQEKKKKDKKPSPPDPSPPKPDYNPIDLIPNGGGIEIPDGPKIKGPQIDAPPHDPSPGEIFMDDTNIPGETTTIIGKEEGPGLEGTFYDFKQTQPGRETDITPAEVAELLCDFVRKGWNQKQFRRYYQSPTKLYSPLFLIPRMPATAAPAAFKCEQRVKDSRWCVIYRGTVKAPLSGTFRFVGAGDDALVVRFNGKTVFDYGWYQLTLGKMTAGSEWQRALTGKDARSESTKELTKAGINIPPVTFYTYSSTPHWNSAIGGFACGREFTVEAGREYPVEVLISEIPGGEFGATLLIEDMKRPAQNRDSKTGSPILPLFRTSLSVPDTSGFKGKEFPPFDPHGPVWLNVDKHD